MINKEDFLEKLAFPENSPLGNNKEIVELLWNILNHMYENGNDVTKNIVTNFLETKQTIQIFENNAPSSYMKFFGALKLNKEDSIATIIHELGHYYLNLLLYNNEEYPEYQEVALYNYFKEINERAKTHCKTNKDLNFTFRNHQFSHAKLSDFLRILCNKELYSKEELAQLGPLSDIISAVWTGGVSFETRTGEKFILPFFHNETYYQKEDTIDYPLVFDEQFANFFTLYTLGLEEQLNVLKELFGLEWYNVMKTTILQIEQELLKRKELKQNR